MNTLYCSCSATPSPQIWKTTLNAWSWLSCSLPQYFENTPLSKPVIRECICLVLGVSSINTTYSFISHLFPNPKQNGKHRKEHTPGSSLSPTTSLGPTFLSNPSLPTTVTVSPLATRARKGPAFKPRDSARFTSNLPRTRGPTTAYASVARCLHVAREGKGRLRPVGWETYAAFCDRAAESDVPLWRGDRIVLWWWPEASLGTFGSCEPWLTTLLLHCWWLTPATCGDCDWVADPGNIVRTTCRSHSCAASPTSDVGSKSGRDMTSCSDDAGSLVEAPAKMSGMNIDKWYNEPGLRFDGGVGEGVRFRLHVLLSMSPWNKLDGPEATSSDRTSG